MPERAPAKVVPLPITVPPATATAEPAPSPFPDPVRIAQHFAPTPTAPPSPAADLCAELVSKLNLADPDAALTQMGYGEWQSTYQDALKAALAASGGAEFFSCVLQSLQAHGVDLQAAAAILAPLSREVTGQSGLPADPGGPLAPPPQQPTPQQQPPPQQPPVGPPAPGIIPSEPLPPPDAYGPELAPSGPGGIILAPSEQQQTSKAVWGVVALVVLGGGIVAWYYAQKR